MDNEKNIESKSEKLATEMIAEAWKISKAKDCAIKCLVGALVVVALGMALINYSNDKDWRALFSSYDFVSQDGEGINNINTGEQGAVNNGTGMEE